MIGNAKALCTTLRSSTLKKEACLWGSSKAYKKRWILWGRNTSETIMQFKYYSSGFTGSVINRSYCCLCFMLGYTLQVQSQKYWDQFINSFPEWSNTIQISVLKPYYNLFFSSLVANVRCFCCLIALLTGALLTSPNTAVLKCCVDPH